MTLSVCMIVKNEEDNLPRCLESIIDIVDEMVIVDTGSQDSTVEIAQKYGAKVFFFEWNDNFSDARNYSLQKATGDWILLMDADDEFELEDREKFLKILKSSESDACFFETLNFAGDKPGMDIIVNLNLRLVRNHKGYQFEGAIHEQIASNIEKINKKAKISTENIRIKHYGYLNKTVVKQNKRDRNIRIIGKELEQNQNDPFMLFNMGNEYYALTDYNKALECYKKSYDMFNPNLGYGPKLIVRLVSTYDELAMQDEEFKIIEEGLKYYPEFTDLEYYRGTRYHRQKKYTLSIKSYKRCLEMGEPNSYLGFIIGVGSFRAHHALAEIYFELEDYDESYNHCIETLKLRPDFLAVFYRIAQILFKKKEDINLIKSRLEAFFTPNLDEPVFTTLHDIFFSEGYYDIALEYITKSEALIGAIPRIIYLKGKCLFFMKKHKEASELFRKTKDDKLNDHNLYEAATYGMALCEILSAHYKKAEIILKRTEGFKDTKTRVVYQALSDILTGGSAEVIAESEETSLDYINIIFEILDTLLKKKEFELFEKSLKLLNLIESKEVLLKLAKLYYCNEYYNLAYQEFIRSIKIFDKIDAEGLRMLQRALMLK